MKRESTCLGFIGFVHLPVSLYITSRINMTLNLTHKYRENISSLNFTGTCMAEEKKTRPKISTWMMIDTLDKLEIYCIDR